MRVLMAALIVAAGLAGCAEAPGAVVTLDVGEALPFEAIMQERPALAAVAIKETSTEATVDLDPLAAERPDHEGNLSYHGLAQVHNEWGRLVDAHVFRYNPMVYVITGFEISLNGIVIEGEYQEARWEIYFDAANGRALGITDLDTSTRSFMDPERHLPFGPHYLRGMMYGMVLYGHGDVTARLNQTFAGYDFRYWVEPYTGERPLPGGCDMYHFVVEMDGEVRPPAKNDPYRDIVCFDDGLVPLWHWAGNESRGALALERVGEGFTWPGPYGEALPPDPFSTAAMEPIAGLAPTSDPIYVPPFDTGNDWATAVHDRVAALRYSVPYQEFELTHGTVYAHDVVTGWPPHTVMPVLGGLFNELTEAARFDETSWVMVTEDEGDDWFWTFVHTLRDGEGRRHYIPDLYASTFEDSMIGYPSMDEIGDVVETTSVRGRLHDLVPQDPNHVNWFVWPQFDVPGIPVAWWNAADVCWDPVQMGDFILFDGKDGHLLALRSTGEVDPCDTAHFRSWMGGQEITVFPATPERPFPIVLDGAGRLALPLPPSAMEWIGKPLL